MRSETGLNHATSAPASRSGEEPAREPVRAGAVDDHAHLDAAWARFARSVAQPAADLVGLPDVVLEVDVVLRGLDRRDDRGVGRRALGVELDATRRAAAAPRRRDRDARELPCSWCADSASSARMRADRLLDELPGAPPPRFFRSSRSGPIKR